MPRPGAKRWNPMKCDDARQKALSHDDTVIALRAQASTVARHLPRCAASVGNKPRDFATCEP
eukprot:14434740-Alexandrium_andersonii.AAC.1